MRSKKKLRKRKSIKHDAKKPRLSLVSPIATFKTALVMTDGESVYGTHNWRETGFAWSRLGDAAQRHITMWLAGMDKDPKSGRSNLDHAAACIMMLQEFESTKPHLDDRFKLPLKELLKLYPG